MSNKEKWMCNALGAAIGTLIAELFARNGPMISLFVCWPLGTVVAHFVCDFAERRSRKGD